MSDDPAMTVVFDCTVFVQALINPHDPDDAPYVDLALAVGATSLVSRDSDLLDLMDDTNAAGRELRRRYPSFHVMTPPALAGLLRERS
jgi:predicted nucleic acid-binding protein